VAVRPDVLNNPGQLAVNLQSGTDGGNPAAMAAVGDAAMDSLDGLSCREYARQFITGIGQQISGLKSTQDNTQAVLNTLASQQEDISGVDVNEEAAKLMTFQRMYQAMAKLIGAQDNMLQVLVETIR
jgi:flagellar hook-associated protein 1